jgi:flagellar basal-body rod protein FlgG
MNHSLINSMVSLQGLQQKLDVISNNIANINTTGFKRREASFQDILTSIQRQPGGFQRQGRLTPPGLDTGWGARISQLQLRMDPGELRETGNPQDFAIDGDALFEVAVPGTDASGNPGEELRWTRDGSFQWSVIPGNPDRLELTTKEGYPVRGVNDEPITVPAGRRIQVRPDGTVLAYDDSAPGSAPEVSGHIKLVRFFNPQLLEQAGSNLFRLTGRTGIPLNQASTILNAGGVPEPGQNVEIKQGYLEQSNVNLADEMSDLLVVQRAYQLNSRAIQSSDTMMELANNLRG